MLFLRCSITCSCKEQHNVDHVLSQKFRLRPLVPRRSQRCHQPRQLLLLLRQLHLGQRVLLRSLHLLRPLLRRLPHRQLIPRNLARRRLQSRHQALQRPLEGRRLRNRPLPVLQAHLPRRAVLRSRRLLMPQVAPPHLRLLNLLRLPHKDRPLLPEQAAQELHPPPLQDRLRAKPEPTVRRGGCPPGGRSTSTSSRKIRRRSTPRRTPTWSRT